jgi:hypothetical protein
LLEVSRPTLFTNKLDISYYELGKLPKVIDAKDENLLRLAEFKAKMEEELKHL